MSNTPKTLTQPECELLLDQLKRAEQTAHKQFCRSRNVLMYLTMLDAGLRVGELVQMQVSYYIFASKPVLALNVPTAIAKGGSERTIPVTDRLQVATARMLLWWKSSGPANLPKPAFTSRLNGRPITARQVQRILFNASKKAIGRRIHPHELRHTFATRLMRTTNSRIVQQLLGHKQLTSTQIYQHPNGDDLLEAIKSLNT